MKFELYDNTIAGKSKFYLGQEDDKIVLHGVDENGDDWDVLELSPDTGIGLYSNVEETLGISTDSNGYPKTFKLN